MKFGDFFCRESGDELLGIYRVGLHLAAGSLQGKWNLNSINLYDKVQNSRTYSLDSLKAKNIAINFRQIGAAAIADSSKPKILSIKRLTSKSLQDWDEVVKYQVKFTDSGTGVSSAYLDLSNHNFKGAVEKHYSFGGELGVSDKCSTIDSETKGKVCLVAGDGKSGVLEFSFRAGILGGEGGAFAPASITLTDKGLNSALVGSESFSKAVLDALTVNLPAQFRSYDSSGPIISELNWSATTIDSGETAATFELQVKVVDRGSGLSLNKRGQPNIQASFSWASPKSSMNGKDNYWASLPQTVSRLSGDEMEGVYRIEVTVPAHSKSGTIYLNSLVAVDRDRKNNRGGLDFDQLISRGFQTSIRNG
jgi:hypothetical protein